MRCWANVVIPGVAWNRSLNSCTKGDKVCNAHNGISYSSALDSPNHGMAQSSITFSVSSLVVVAAQNVTIAWFAASMIGWKWCEPSNVVGDAGRGMTLMGHVEKSRMIPWACRKSIPRIAGMMSDATTMNACSICRSPRHIDIDTWSTTGIGSPAADTSCNLLDGILQYCVNCFNTFSRINETDDPESSVISTLTLLSSPWMVAAPGRTTATTTTLTALGCCAYAP